MKFGVVPSVLVVLTIVGITTYLNISSKYVAQANSIFGVFVAYESIASLPNNSTDAGAAATLDIEMNVQQMQAVVSGGVMEMDRFSEQVRRGVTNVSEVGQRLTKVIDQVGSVQSSFSEVTEGMQSQVQGADQIRQAMDALTQNASRAQEATSEFSQAATALRKVIGGDITV